MITLGDLRFERLAPKPLLGLDIDRDAPDLEFFGFGWGIVRELTLSTSYGAKRVTDALVVALHTPDDPGAELELEFWVDDGDDEVAALVPWPVFAERFLKPLLGEQREVVLAMCNPARMRITAPAWLGSRRLHYAEGDVISWLDSSESGQEQLRLHARRWLTASS